HRTLEHNTISRLEAISLLSLIVDIQTFGNLDVFPFDIPTREDIQLKWWTLFCVANVCRLQITGQLSEMLPILGLPHHENPIDLSGLLFARDTIWIEPETPANSVVNNDHLVLRFNFGEI